MIRQKINIVAYLIFSFTFVFNQQVNKMSIFEPMNTNMSMELKFETNKNRDNLTQLETNESPKCQVNICYEMCKTSTAAVNMSLKDNTTPVYTSSILNNDYIFSNNEVKLNEFFRPPKNFLI